MKVEPRSPHFQDLPDAIKRALAIEPDRRSGTIRDVDHVVILMQENRSFDHYFGTLPGVRGFADPHPAPTPGGDVLTQAGDGIRTGPMPCSPSIAATRRWATSRRTPGTTPSAPGTTAAWTSGCPPRAARHGRLRPRRTAVPDRAGRRLHAVRGLSLLDAGRHQSQPAVPVDRRQRSARRGRRPGLVSTHDRLGPAAEGYAWTTYPERLQQAGVDWRIYQDMADNFNDNPWPAFANTARRMPRR